GLAYPLSVHSPGAAVLNEFSDLAALEYHRGGGAAHDQPLDGLCERRAVRRVRQRFLEAGVSDPGMESRDLLLALGRGVFGNSRHVALPQRVAEGNEGLHLRAAERGLAFEIGGDGVGADGRVELGFEPDRIAVYRDRAGNPHGRYLELA